MSIVRQHFQKVSSLKPVGQFELNFIYSLLANDKGKFICFRPGHIAEIAAMPIYANQSAEGAGGPGIIRDNKVSESE